MLLALALGRWEARAKISAQVTLFERFFRVQVVSTILPSVPFWLVNRLIQQQ